jgi:putative membrane protein
VLAVAALGGLLRQRPPDALLLVVMVALSVLLLWVLARGLDENKSLIFLAVALTIALAFEAFAVNRSRLLTHQIHPQLMGVPIAILFGWFVALAASYAVTAVLWGRRYVAVTAAGTAALATLLDFTLDPMGLATGWWMWQRPGGYATSLQGINGVAGIPWSNFAGWLVLTVLVVVCFEALTRKGARDRQIFARDTFDAAVCVLVYFALCMPGLFWLLRTGHWALFLVPAVPLAALAALSQPRLRRPPRW